MRNWNTTGHPDWIEPKTEHIQLCESCWNELNYYEKEDPIVLNGMVFCDRCASDYLRFGGGNFRTVSEITKDLLPDNPFSAKQFGYQYFNYKQTN